MTEQKLNRRLGNLNNWDIFWEIYFDEVDHNNYQEVSLKNLILMNSPPKTIDFTDCFEKMLFTVMKFINMDRNPFKNNGIIDNDFMNYIVSNFDTTMEFNTLNNDNAVEEYIYKLHNDDVNLAIDTQKLSIKLPLEIIEMISDDYIDDTYKLRQYIEDLLQLDNPINRTPQMIEILITLAANKNPHSFDVIKKFIKKGILTWNQELFENLAANTNDEAVDLIINNLQTHQNPNGIILNTPELQPMLAKNTNIRALNFYAENYRRGNFIDVFNNRTIDYSEEILVTLMSNKNSYQILDNLGIINQINTNSDDSYLLANNRSDNAVNMLIPYLIGLNYDINGDWILTNLAKNTNPIAVRTIISYLRIYTRSLINSGRTPDVHFDRIIIELAGNSNDEAVDYVFEVLNNPVLNYIPNEDFWIIYITNTNDKAVNYILEHIDIISHLPSALIIFRRGLLNKHPRMREYLRDNFLTNDMVKFLYLFLNKEIFEIDAQDRRHKKEQIKTFMNNVYEKFNKRSVYRDESIYGLE